MVSFTVFLYRINLLVMCQHDFVQVDFIIKKFIKLQSLKRVEHLTNTVLELFNQILIFNLQLTLTQQQILLLDLLLLFVENASQHFVLVVLCLQRFVKITITYLSSQVEHSNKALRRTSIFF